MIVLLVLLCMACGLLCLFYVRLCADIRFLSKQLGEIQRGSHIELTTGSRQKALLLLCRRLNHVLSSMDRAHIQYERSEKLLKQNITNLAHDIRTPLTGACGYVQLAGECTETERRQHYLQAAEVRLRELEDMLEKLFLYTKLVSEDFTLSEESMKNIQVLPLLSDCLLNLYARFEEKGCSPRVSFRQEGLSIFAEEESLRRIFLNLIQNALVHGAGDLTITQEGNSLIFENPVESDERIDPEQIFERFYKADPARRKGSSGLGLFIVRELTEKMGGAVRAENGDGTLRIVLTFSGVP